MSSPPASTSPATPPTGPPKKGMFKSRVGSVMRRTSSTFSLGSRSSSTSRPGTPAATQEPRDPDAASLTQLDTSSSLPPPDPAHHAPSPIAESPAREAAALSADPIGPSPLAAVVTNEQPNEATAAPASEPPNEPVDSSIASEAAPEAPKINEIPPTPADPAPHASGPAFTAEPDQMSDYSTERTTERTKTSENNDIPETARYPNAPSQEAKPGLSVAEGAASYFDLSAGQAVSAPENVGSPSSLNIVSSQTTPRASDTRDTKEDVLVERKQSKASISGKTPGHGQDLVSNPWASGTASVSGKPSRSSLAPSDAGTRPNQPAYIPQNISARQQGDVSYTTSKASSVNDPFVDPPHMTSQVLPPVAAVTMPVPEPAPEQELTSPHAVNSPPVTMPLPNLNEVMVAKSVRTMPSGYSIGGGYNYVPTESVDHDADETRPLLSHPEPQNSSSSYLHPSFSGRFTDRAADGSWPVSGPLLHTLGWVEYTLPDATFYYVHPNLRVISDIDLRQPKKLEAVTGYFDRKNGGDSILPPAGWDLWLRDVSKRPRDFRPMANWIDHRQRIIISTHPTKFDAGRLSTDDKLDMEYRYWTFLELHPAHIALPSTARREAMDALTWSFTDRLLPSSQHVPAPFTQSECHDLMQMLQNFNETDNSGIQSIVQTRIVCRILIRTAQWRQRHFRSHKPLPDDVVMHGRHRHDRGSPVGRAFMDVFISVFCLGIPYALMDRSHRSMVDLESGIRTAGPMLLVGACACLIAAIILSASVSFISLPGIDSVARMAGFVAILCSTASLISAVIALFRYKADLDRANSPMVPLRTEGMVYRRSIVMSLPLIFLTYSIAAFITGIIAYSIKGATLTDIGSVTRYFDNHTKWTVVGTFVGLSGILAIAAVMMRR